MRPTTIRSDGVVIVHDYLTQRGGAERVVLAMLEAFPDAPLVTSVYAPRATFAGFADREVITTGLDRVRLLRRHHRYAFALLAPTFARVRIEAPTVLCSSSGWSHGVQVEGRKQVYCYTPARWLYRHHERSGDAGGRLGRLALGALGGPLVEWDRRAAASAEMYLTSSREVRRRIRAVYDRDAHILAPPPGLEVDGEQERPPGVGEEPFVLCVSRLLPYKNVDVVAEAARRAGLRLVVVGRGPLGPRLRVDYPGLVHLESISDSWLRWLYSHASLNASAAFEDFGLTPLEAAQFGCPTVALAAGGFLDSIVPEVTGVLVPRARPVEFATAMAGAIAHPWDRNALRAHASAYSRRRFIEGLRSAVLGGDAPLDARWDQLAG